MHVTLLHAAARDGLLDRDDDDVADRRDLALRATQHLDALHPPSAGIVGDLEVRLPLDHGLGLLNPAQALSAAESSRSEEHTSELQSLMRSSYAVFCLKQQTRQQFTPQLPPSTHNTTT